MLRKTRRPGPSGPKRATWQKGRIEDWADESLEVGRGTPILSRAQTEDDCRTGDSLGREYERVELPAGDGSSGAFGASDLPAMLNEIFKSEPDGSYRARPVPAQAHPRLPSLTIPYEPA